MEQVCQQASLWHGRIRQKILVATAALMRGFTYVDVISLPLMIGYTASMISRHILKVPEHAHQSTSSFIIIDDIERLIFHKSDGDVAKMLVFLLTSLPPRAKKKEDDNPQTSGVNENHEVSLRQFEHNTPEGNVHETSKGEENVAQIRLDVDTLEQQVCALEAGVDTVDDKAIDDLTEMLIQQLLKLDGIQAEGRGKTQRKIEICRVQLNLDDVFK